ncbi:MAG: aspartate kinase [Arenicella sp.]
MPLIVEKFGGTSVGSVERIKAVASGLAERHAKGEQLIVVVSAMSGQTNNLIKLAHEISETPAPREMDVLLSTGEQVTIALLSMALNELGLKAKSYTGSQIRMLTDSAHMKARIEDIDDAKIMRDINDGNIIVAAGFQGVDSDGNITTLGRGGSDTSAVAIAAALKADECRIYTDVDGIYTTDPRVVPQARRLKQITFEEMLELASLGAKVLQTRSVEFAGKYRVPLRVLSSFEPDEGTLITYDNEANKMEAPLVSGVAFNRDEVMFTVRGIPDQPGVANKVLGPVSAENINVDLIVQNVSPDGKSNFTFTTNRTELSKCKSVLDDIVVSLGADDLDINSDIAKISIVGVGMVSHAGVAAQMFEALGKESVNIELISTSEIKISVIVKEKYTELAVKTLHDSFGLAGL